MKDSGLEFRGERQPAAELSGYHAGHYRQGSVGDDGIDSASIVVIA